MAKNNFKARSRFEQWTRDQGGTKTLAKRLGLSQQCVQHWFAGRNRPRIKTAFRIIELSQGALTAKDILKVGA